jgi:hypothetical protein
MKQAATIPVEVAAIEQVTPLIKQFTLRPVGGGNCRPLRGAVTSLWSCTAGTGRSATHTP